MALCSAKQFGNKVMIGVHSPTITDELKEIITTYEPHLILFASAIESKQDVTVLIRQLKLLYTQNIPLIAVDLEGGMVNRFKNKEGFEGVGLLSAKDMASNGIDCTKEEASKIAHALYQCGFNTGLSPVLDLDLGCPAISKYERSFSRSPAEVLYHAETFIDELLDYNIIPCIKHLWGHGSAKSDTHFSTGKPSDVFFNEEMNVFVKAIKDGIAPMMMASHLHCPQLDLDLPCSLSKTSLSLARDYGFKEIIISDDMFMRALSDHYSIKDMFKLFFEASGDIMILGKPDLATDYFDESILDLLNDGYNMLINGEIDTLEFKQSLARLAKFTEDHL
jgi:beta-N-acetylhexosaminidase